MKRNIRLGIIDDHQIVIDGLKLLLNDQPNLKVEIESTVGIDFLREIKQRPVDLILTDIIMPNQLNGIEIAKHIKANFPQMGILVLSMNNEPKVAFQLMNEIQVDGFISKGAGKQELLLAINTIASGRTYFSDEIIKLVEIQSKINRHKSQLHISKREMEVINCITKRYSNKMIADELFISERTVETHRKNIYRKTNTKGESALISFLTKNEII